MGGSWAALSRSKFIRSWAACLSMSQTQPSPLSQTMYVCRISPAMRQGASLGGSMVCCSDRSNVCCRGMAGTKGRGGFSAFSAFWGASATEAGGLPMDTFSTGRKAVR